MLGAHDGSWRLITCCRSAPCSPSSWPPSSIQQCAHASPPQNVQPMSLFLILKFHLTPFFAPGAQSSSRKRIRLRQQTREEAEWQQQEDEGSARVGCSAAACLLPCSGITAAPDSFVSLDHLPCAIKRLARAAACVQTLSSAQAAVF
jgi:hypothetical protein